MKSKFYFWGFAVIFLALVQLLVYYANPVNLPILEAITTKPLVLAYNIIIFALIVALLVWLFLQIRIEDKHEQQRQAKVIKSAIKKALKEYGKEEHKDNIKKSN